MLSEQVLDIDVLPLKLCGISHCFRTEAGAHGRATRGIFRVHQFTKVEMFAFTLPEQSEQMLQQLLGIERKIFDRLGIPYRVIDTPSGDRAARPIASTIWKPGCPAVASLGEITSTSNCTDYQARRLGDSVPA